MSRRPYKGTDPRTFDQFYRRPLLGLDEVGVGAWAGPVCVAGVVLPKSPALDILADAGLRDSKEMTALSRDKVEVIIREYAVWLSVKFAWCWEVEEEGVSGVLDRLFTSVMTEYILKYGTSGSILLDGPERGGIPYTYDAIPKGDQKSQTIAAASVLAKVARDNLMVKLAAEYPGYGFEDNVGYGTRTHREGLNRLGPCEIHRMTYKPVKRAGGLTVPKRHFSVGFRQS